MSDLYGVLPVLVAVLVAIQQWRQMRARGQRIDWRQTLLAIAGVILVTAASVGALILGLRFGDFFGLAGFVVVEAVGLTLLIRAIKRHWVT